MVKKSWLAERQRPLFHAAFVAHFVSGHFRTCASLRSHNLHVTIPNARRVVAGLAHQRRSHWGSAWAARGRAIGADACRQLGDPGQKPSAAGLRLVLNRREPRTRSVVHVGVFCHHCWRRRRRRGSVKLVPARYSDSVCWRHRNRDRLRSGVHRVGRVGSHHFPWHTGLRWHVALWLHAALSLRVTVATCRRRSMSVGVDRSQGKGRRSGTSSHFVLPHRPMHRFGSTPRARKFFGHLGPHFRLESFVESRELVPLFLVPFAASLEVILVMKSAADGTPTW
jgi:hypothetical protein